MEKRYKILIVDDSEYNRSLLSDILSVDYEILEASDGLEAMAVLNQRHSEILLMLLDIVMPKMDGFEVLAFMNKSGWIGEIPIITISAETSSSYIDHAYDLGAIEYISRPFDEKTVKQRVKNTIMLYAKQKMLEGMVTEQILEKEQNNLLMVEILSNIVEFRNGESGLHVLHIRIITEMLLSNLLRRNGRYSLSTQDVATIVNASALHDIGKISIPESILNKPGKLTREEFEIMKTHSAIGAQILENAQYRQHERLVQVARDICRWHHERYDGRGYPDGIAGEEIPIAAQVVSLADVYDALTSQRVYKPAYPHEQAMGMILHGECGAFNPLLLDSLKDIGPGIDREISVRSVDGISKIEIQHVTRKMIENGGASNRTLALLEQERTKYQFFASMSKEIQFEYSYQTDILTMSEWGAKQLGIAEIIVNPMQNPELHKVFCVEDYLDFRRRLRSASPLDPIVTKEYRLTVDGKPRWYKAVARALWVDDEALEIIGIIGKFIDVHEEHEKLDRIVKLSELDSLTRLYNHASARKKAEEILGKNRQKRYALILLDVDGFKCVNDSFGHLSGDKILTGIARRIADNVRDGDIAARVGGDEFMIFFENSGEVEPVVKRVFAEIAKPYSEYEITISMGAAVSPKDGGDYETLFHHADQALYWVKKHGKQCYQFYNDSMRELLSALSPIDQPKGEQGGEEKASL